MYILAVVNIDTKLLAIPDGLATSGSGAVVGEDMVSDLDLLFMGFELILVSEVWTEAANGERDLMTGAGRIKLLEAVLKPLLTLSREMGERLLLSMSLSGDDDEGDCSMVFLRDSNVT